MGRRGLYYVLNSDSEELLQPPALPHFNCHEKSRRKHKLGVSPPPSTPPTLLTPFLSLSLSLSLTHTHTHTHRHPSQEKLSSEGGEGQILLLPSVLKNLSGETVAAKAQVTNDKQGSSRSRGKSAGDGNKWGGWGSFLAFSSPSQAHKLAVAVCSNAYVLLCLHPLPPHSYVRETIPCSTSDPSSLPFPLC